MDARVEIEAVYDTALRPEDDCGVNVVEFTAEDAQGISHRFSITAPALCQLAASITRHTARGVAANAGWDDDLAFGLEAT